MKRQKETAGQRQRGGSIQGGDRMCRSKRTTRPRRQARAVLCALLLCASTGTTTASGAANASRKASVLPAMTMVQQTGWLKLDYKDNPGAGAGKRTRDLRDRLQAAIPLWSLGVQRLPGLRDSDSLQDKSAYLAWSQEQGLVIPLSHQSQARLQESVLERAQRSSQQRDQNRNASDSSRKESTASDSSAQKEEAVKTLVPGEEKEADLASAASRDDAQNQIRQKHSMTKLIEMANAKTNEKEDPASSSSPQESAGKKELAAAAPAASIQAADTPAVNVQGSAQTGQANTGGTEEQIIEIIEETTVFFTPSVLPDTALEPGDTNGEVAVSIIAGQDQGTGSWSSSFVSPDQKETGTLEGAEAAGSMENGTPAQGAAASSPSSDTASSSFSTSTPSSFSASTGAVGNAGAGGSAGSAGTASTPSVFQPAGTDASSKAESSTLFPSSSASSSSSSSGPSSSGSTVGDRVDDKGTDINGSGVNKTIDMSRVDYGFQCTLTASFLHQIQKGNTILEYQGSQEDAAEALSELVTVYCSSNTSVDYFCETSEDGTKTVRIADYAAKWIVQQVQQADEGWQLYLDQVEAICKKVQNISDIRQKVDEINAVICSSYTYQITNKGLGEFARRKVGQCWHFAKLFADVCLASGMKADLHSTISHSWVSLEVQGKVYRFDPAFNATCGSITAYSWQKL